MGSLTREAEGETAAAAAAAAALEEWSDEAVVYVNGVRRVLPDGLAHLTLLQYLRGRAPTPPHPPSLPACALLLLFLSKHAGREGLKFARCRK
jgi:hypothetical protein